MCCRTAGAGQESSPWPPVSSAGWAALGCTGAVSFLILRKTGKVVGRFWSESLPGRSLRCQTNQHCWSQNVRFHWLLKDQDSIVRPYALCADLCSAGGICPGCYCWENSCNMGKNIPPVTAIFLIRVPLVGAFPWCSQPWCYLLPLISSEKPPEAGTAFWMLVLLYFSWRVSRLGLVRAHGIKMMELLAVVVVLVHGLPIVVEQGVGKVFI